MADVKSTIVCDECSVTFTTRSNLSRHNRRFHNAAKIEYVACPESNCTFRCARTSLLESHLVDVHGKYVEKECHHFNTLEEFAEWKCAVERDEMAKYILRKKRNRNKCYVLRCHRSGNPERSKTKGKRPRKKGTIKIGKTCPSRMKVFESNTGIDVMYVKTHLGHDKENVFLRKRKDEADDDVSSNMLHVEALVRNWKSAGDEAICYCKLNGVADPGKPNFDETDFVLVMVNGKLEGTLRQRKMEMACVDVSNAIGPFRYYLVTLLVADKSAVFPVAFLLTNRKDQKVYEFFFNLVNVRIGRINPEMFMSVDDAFLYNAWSNVMGPCQKSVLCSWHLRQSWNKKLNNLTDASLRSRLRQELNDVLTEVDLQTLRRKLCSFLQRLGNDPVTRPLRDYFDNNYSHRVEQWALCFQVQGYASWYPQLEKLHGHVHKLYFGHKPTKRIDVIANELHNFLLTGHRKKPSSKQHKLTSHDLSMRKGHVKSFDGTFSYIRETIDGNYYVSSFTQTFELYYTVSSNEADCDCDDTCQDCKLCVHRFKCSCLEHSETNDICKHIHLVGRYLLETRTLTEHNYANETSTLCLLGIDNDVPNVQLELEIYNSNATNVGPDIVLETEKQNVLLLMQELRERCVQMQSLDEVLSVKNTVKQMLLS